MIPNCVDPRFKGTNRVFYPAVVPFRTRYGQKLIFGLVRKPMYEEALRVKLARGRRAGAGHWQKAYFAAGLRRRVR
jgi:hypothetical protein